MEVDGVHIMFKLKDEGIDSQEKEITSLWKNIKDSKNREIYIEKRFYYVFLIYYI